MNYRLLTKVVDLREGEGPLALGAFGALFGIVAGHTILETARDALFLSRLPPSKLTLVYAAVAIGTLLVSSWNTAFVRRFGQRNALIFTLVTGAYVTTLFHFQHLHGTLLYLLYGWSAIIGAVLGLQFWMYAGQLFTVSQGKRLFGPIASGGVLGAVVGASATAGALAMVSVKSLLLLSAAVFTVTAVLVTLLPAGEPRATAPTTALSPRERVASAGGLIDLFRKVPYLRQLAAFTALSTSALLVVDYLFKSIAAAKVPHAELGAFFARTYTVLNVVSLAVQLLLAGRILRKAGVVPALLILPVCIAFGSGAMVIAGGVLALALFAKGADGGLRYSLQRVASELLWMPLEGDVRTRTKSVLDSVFGKVMQAVVAGVLLLLVTFGLGTPRILALVALVLTLGWFGSVAVLQRSYVDLFRRALRRGSLDVQLEAHELDLTSIEALLEALSSRDPLRATAAMGLLAERNRSRLIPGLILYHESADVVIQALKLIATPDRVDWIPLAERLLEHGDRAVRVAAVRALGAAGAHAAVERARDDDDPSVRAHAALALQDDASHAVETLLRIEGAEGRVTRLALLDAIYDHPAPRWADVVLELAASAKNDAELGERAARAMTRLLDPRFIPWLVPRLAMREGRSTVRDALVYQGEPALDAVAHALLDEATPPKVRLHLPRTISRFPTQRAADLLLEVLRLDPRGFVRYKALRGLGRVVAGNVKIDRGMVMVEVRKNLVEVLRFAGLEVALARGGDLTLPTAKLVLGLLADKRRQALERSFRLLQIAHKNEDIRRVYGALTTGDKRLRAQALEFLDALTLVASRDRRREPQASMVRDDVRELFRLVNDDLPDAERVARGVTFLKRPPANHTEALALLLEDGDETLATFSAFYALELGGPELTRRVGDTLSHRPSLQVATPLVPALAPASLRGPVSVAHA